LNGGSPAPLAASTARAYAVIDDASVDTRTVTKGICQREPRVGAFGTHPWSSGSPCAPAARYWCPRGAETGDQVPVTFEFEKAGDVKLLLDVQGIGPERPGVASGDLDTKKVPARMKA
jgi:hypothetical protein